MKYSIMNRIDSSNWAPTNHSLSITPTFAKLVYQIETKYTLNFGEYVFNQTMKHADSYIVKLQITFPCLITRIILKQHPQVFHAEEMRNKKSLPLTLDKKLFVETHIPNIMVKHRDQTIGGSSSPVSKATIKDVLLELMEVSKCLQETITAIIIRKKKADGLIKIMNKKKETCEQITDSEK